MRYASLIRVAQRRFVPRPEDNYGCDWPFEGLSCTAAGNCCDTHDLCFYANSCDVTSWLGFGLSGLYCL